MNGSNIVYLVVGAGLFLLARSWLKKESTTPRPELTPGENGAQVIDMALWKEMRGWRQSAAH